MLESFNKSPLGQGPMNVVYNDDIIGMIEKTNSRLVFGRTMLLVQKNVPFKFCSIVITTVKRDKDGNIDEDDEQNKKLEELAKRARAVFNVV